MSGEGVEAEESEGDGVEPVGQRGLFEVTDTVDVEGDPITGQGHVARCAGVGAIGVVEQGRGEEGGEEDDDPEAAEQGNGWRTAWTDLR